MGYTHLSDDRLIDVHVQGDAAVPGARQHLDACPDCSARRMQLTQMLDHCTDATAADADAAFPTDRLARQHARILQRIEQDGRPGRIISFPASRPGEPSTLRSRPSAPWIAAAAVAGLVIGLLAGQVVGGPRRAGNPPAVQAIVRPSAPAQTLRAVATTMSDEEFLVRVDSAAERSGGSALGPLDELTPRVWEVAAR